MTRLLAIVASVAAATPAWAQGGAAFTNPGRFMPSDGQALYEDVCQGCHMPGGVGAEGAGAYPRLAGNPRLQSGGYAMLLVLNGRKGMPALGAMLGDAQIAAVVNYVRSHFGNDYPDAVTNDDVKAARGGR